MEEMDTFVQLCLELCFLTACSTTMMDLHQSVSVSTPDCELSSLWVYVLFRLASTTIEYTLNVSFPAPMTLYTF